MSIFLGFVSGRFPIVTVRMPFSSFAPRDDGSAISGRSALIE